VGAPSHLQTGVIHEVGGEAPGRSPGGIILNGPLILLDNGLRVGHSF
jgi:hypothetical protein